ncbi:MAG: alpha-mannosidase, partial [bacterium]
MLAREDVMAFIYDLCVLRQLASQLDENSLRRGRIMRCLEKVFSAVDAMPAETDESSWRPKLDLARNAMRPLLALKNGPTAPWLGIIGHSHIDTAWLWTLAETWRKCARTFSSVLNLMVQYPEFKFLQSQPCQTEVIRREYPGVFKRMKKMVKAGRWEPNGAMWVEPDCNIPSGESFVRQLIVGQTATREMFGYTSDTLWLPDVFGYSAALPQLLQGCGVKYFCTTKIAWNDTTRFPYDTFTWRGIDGTPVLAHFNSIHCTPDPAALFGQWNWVQHKDIQDRRLCAFGYGDGGGGPMAEMCETARRVKDLEGCPRAEYMTVSAFMKSIQRELTELPEWSGELYMEGHRGTLTSIAKIKRGNRKTEFALREAEFLSTLAALQGTKYPATDLLETWKVLLTNQFHDILPGSSIQAVNDEAIGALDACLQKAKGISTAALGHLAGSGSGKATSFMVLNSLSWERRGELILDNVPKGMAPSAPELTAQWFEDILGRDMLAVSGLTVPALGGTMLPMMTRRHISGQSPF